MQIGEKIRALRLKNQLTLEELANRCELSKGFLSQVERDLTSPSIATLEDILEALGSDLSEFFAKEKQKQVVFTSDDFFELEKEDRKILWIVPNAQKNHMEPILLTLPVGGTSQHMEIHEGEEFGYVLSGKVDLVIKKKQYSLKQGETFYIDGSKEHYLKNTGQEQARVIWVCDPPVF